MLWIITYYIIYNNGAEYNTDIFHRAIQTKTVDQLAGTQKYMNGSLNFRKKVYTAVMPSPRMKMTLLVESM